MLDLRTRYPLFRISVADLLACKILRKCFRRLSAKPWERRNTGSPRLPLDSTAVQSFQQLWSVGKIALGLSVCGPPSIPLVHLGPLPLFSRDCTLVELIQRLRGILGDLLGGASLSDLAQIVVHRADDASLFPCLALRCLGASFVALPSTFWNHPAISPS